MTLAEQLISEALSLCRLLPGSWDKRFIRSTADMDKNTPLSPKQKFTLWKIAKKYRDQIRRRNRVFEEMIEKHWNALHEGAGIQGERRTFEFGISQNLADWDLRLIYSDWLEEHGELTAAEGQRWQAVNQKHPRLIGAGASYGPGATLPINWGWQWQRLTGAGASYGPGATLPINWGWQWQIGSKVPSAEPNVLPEDVWVPVELAWSPTRITAEEKLAKRIAEMAGIP